MALEGVKYTILTHVASATVDAATGSLYTSVIDVQGHQRVNIGIVIAMKLIK